MERVKIVLTYSDGDSYNTESVWAEKEGEYYKIKNVPFFASNIALDDIVKVENDNGTLYFDELVTASGNSVVQIVFFDMLQFEEITKELVKLGCGWEGSHLPSLISVNIPKGIDYSKVKEYLESKFQNEIIDYREACLGFN